MMKLRECLEKAVVSLRKRAELTAENINLLEIRPHIYIYTEPKIIGELASFDDDVITVESFGETTHYDTSVASFPIRIELEWIEWPSSGYYGETLEEYGGEPVHLPTTRCHLTILGKSPGKWKIGRVVRD